MKNSFYLPLFIILFSACEKSLSECYGLIETSSNSFSNIKALFIGNLHTYTNAIPCMIDLMAQSKGDTAYAQQEAPGGYTLNKQHI